MKYYYGNSYKEAISNDPVEINSTRELQQYQDAYNFVIPVDDIDDEDDEDALIKYLVTSEKGDPDLYFEFDSREEAFECAKENIENIPCVTKVWQSNKNKELGLGEDYKEKEITYEDAELSKMIKDQIN